MPLVFTSPPIDTFPAHLLAFAFAFSYVGCLYISKNARLSFSSHPQAPNANGIPRNKHVNERWRDDPGVIRARLLAVTVATTLCCTGVFVLLWLLIGDTVNKRVTTLEATALHLGFTAGWDMQAMYPHLLTPVIYLGPLYARYLGRCLPFQHGWTLTQSVHALFGTWQGLRNYLVAPVTEEVVFRACILAVYHFAGASRHRMILCSPLWFGMAHLHHAWDTYNRYGRTKDAAQRAVLVTLLQLIYTTLFGIHCAFLFLRTGSVLPPISAHIFCNIMGLPDVMWEVVRYKERRSLIVLFYTLGLLGFVFAIGPWTQTSGSLYWR